MSTVDIRLPESMKRYLDEEVTRRGYKDASEFVQSLIEAEQHRDLEKELEQSLLEALDSASSPLTPQDFEDIRREGIAHIERRRRSS